MKLTVIALVTLLAAWALGACSIIPPVGDTAADALASVTAADLDTAIAQADADGDKVGKACWVAMKGWLGTRPAAPKVVGAFSAIQAARSARARIAAGVPEVVYADCARVVIDAQGVLLRLGLIAAGKPPLP